MKKRILSVISAIIISLTLLVSAIPANAFIYQDNTEKLAFQLVDLINKERAAHQLQPLQIAEPLCDAAQYQANQISLDINNYYNTAWNSILNRYHIRSVMSRGVGAITQIPVYGQKYITAQAVLDDYKNTFLGNYSDRYNYVGVGRVQRGSTYYWDLFFLTDYEQTDLPTPQQSTLTFNTSGLTNAFKVRATNWDPFLTYNMCFSVANESSKTVYFHGVDDSRAERVEIPETVVNPNNGKTYTVIYIGDKPTTLTQNLALRQSIRYLVVPKTVLSFSKRAFYNGSLISVRVEGPNAALAGIAERTFENCYELVSAGFQNCPNLSTIDKRAFCMCNSLGSINFAQKGTDVMFAYNNQTVFGASMHKTTVLFMPNHKNTTKCIDLFSTDTANWNNGKLRIYTSKSEVYENFDDLRAQNTSSTLLRVTPNS